MFHPWTYVDDSLFLVFMRSCSSMDRRMSDRGTYGPVNLPQLNCSITMLVGRTRTGAV